MYTSRQRLLFCRTGTNCFLAPIEQPVDLSGEKGCVFGMVVEREIVSDR
jgi:hypothetical protein